MSLGEFDLIARIRARVQQRGDVVLGIGDDAALLQPPSGRQLVVTADTLNDGVHFPGETAPADVGWKALAVNLSDLAAMGAEPAWCTLSLSLPEADSAWTDAFLDGFLELARQHDIALIGGDTTRGPLSISVTAMGFIEPGRALRRDAAQVGDEIWVSGTLGDAAAALAQLGGHGDAALRVRLDRPTPRVEVGRALIGIANAAVDISDGLLADLGHICERSGVGAEIEMTSLPASPALQQAFETAQRWSFQAAGGDDYELCFTAPPSHRDELLRVCESIGVAATRIGRIVRGSGIVALDADSRAWQALRQGFDHFSR
ncbi:thiamine-phosphate kinase [Pseudoxanthomonas sp. UTMC 1351]|uniref:thiamine-phosphate kinase n=1 Tax=Pseudoxanthomonas sp. UTMC 1351 TaxID=2695853 RepID=UPI0034CEBBDE